MNVLLSERKTERQPKVLNPAKTARQLLRLVRALQPISRIEIARCLNIHRSTVTEIVKPLIEGDIIREESYQPEYAIRGHGRPPIGLSFNDEDIFFVGLNLGVRHSQVGLATISGKVLAEEEFETPKAPEVALKTAREKIEKLCARVKNRKLRSIGVSVPGTTDEARLKLLYAPHLDWSNVEVAEAITFGNVPVVVENDATAAAIFESRIKLRHSTNGLLNNFILVRSGTGIGVGLVMDGEVYRGTERSQGLAGEFGHMTIVAGGKPCACGNRGCWEKYASAASAASLYMGDQAGYDSSRMPRFVDIVALAEAGDIRAQRTLEKIGEYLGIGIANVIMGIGVQRVIVSGRLVYGWKYINKPVRDAIKKSIVGKTLGWTVECGEPKGSALGGAIEVTIEEYIAKGLTV